MSAEQACQLLGVKPDAGFEEVLRAKTRLLQQKSGPSSTEVPRATCGVRRCALRRARASRTALARRWRPRTT